MMKSRSTAILFRGVALLLLGGWVGVARTGEIAASAPSTAKVWEVWELRTDGPGLPPGLNRHDPAHVSGTLHVTAPDDTVAEIPLFYGQPHRRVRSPAEALRKADRRGVGRKRPEREFVPDGPASWFARYSPGQTGGHAYKVVFTVKGVGESAGPEGRFVAEPARPGARGMVRRHPELVGRFQTDDGRGWFALGTNICWVASDQGVEQYELYFDEMAKAGGNYLRLWLCTWDLDVFGPKPLAPDGVVAARLDAVFAEAAARGLYIQLCIENFHDFRFNWDKNPLNAANGGPCADRFEFWTQPEALAQHRAQLRYLVARYSAYANLMSWELWNEMDYALLPEDIPYGKGPSSAAESKAGWLKRSVVIPWARDMAAEIKRLDPHRHPVSTSLGMHVNWPELWKLPEMDFAQFHSYIHYLSALRTDLERDGARLALACHQAIARYGKPALFSEFGYMGEGAASSMNPRDPEGILLHNALWSVTMSGSAGTPMFWWWDNYIHPKGLYRHYRALSRFLEPVDWNEPFEPVRDETPILRVLGLRGRNQSLAWLQNRENTWDRRITEKKTPRTLRAVTVEFPIGDAGPWRVEWYDPYAGVVVRVDEAEGVAVGDGHRVLRLTPPEFANDIAARMRPVVRSAAGEAK